jgi:carbon monoxide dehydrogenase subunit G
MILDNEVSIGAPADDVFRLINDVESVVTCLPGATLEGRDGDTYRGRIQVKVGPIKAAYGGTVRFLHVDPEQRVLRMSGSGADTHGNGDAEADFELSVVPDANGSRLRVHTDLVIRGKIAQFGKGAIATVSNRLLSQFASNLAAQLEAPADAYVAAAAPGLANIASNGATRTGPPSDAGSPDQALDGLGMLFPPHVGRAATVAAALGLACLQGYLFGRLQGQKALIKELRRGR